MQVSVCHGSSVSGSSPESRQYEIDVSFASASKTFKLHPISWTSPFIRALALDPGLRIRCGVVLHEVFERVWLGSDVFAFAATMFQSR